MEWGFRTPRGTSGKSPTPTQTLNQVSGVDSLVVHTRSAPIPPCRMGLSLLTDNNSLLKRSILSIFSVASLCIALERLYIKRNKLWNLKGPNRREVERLLVAKTLPGTPVGSWGPSLPPSCSRLVDLSSQCFRDYVQQGEHDDNIDNAGNRKNMVCPVYLPYVPTRNG